MKKVLIANDLKRLCTDNISATGMLITAEVKAEEVLAQGDRVAFSFYLPDGTRISARGIVERVIKQRPRPMFVYTGSSLRTSRRRSKRPLRHSSRKN